MLEFFKENNSRKADQLFSLCSPDLAVHFPARHIFEVRKKTEKNRQLFLCSSCFYLICSF